MKAWIETPRGPLVLDKVEYNFYLSNRYDPAAVNQRQLNPSSNLDEKQILIKCNTSGFKRWFRIPYEKKELLEILEITNSKKWAAEIVSCIANS